MPKFRYDDLTWVEVREAVAAKKAILVPIGSIEDHGPHLPLNTDNVIVEAVCFEAARRASDELLSLPVLPVGFEDHHMDFPGSLTSSMETLLSFFADAAISVARHGFTHIMLVNGHGSNSSLVELAARKAVLQTGALVGAMAGNAAVGSLTVGGKTLVDLLYPVGSLYFSAASTDPGTVLGGTWKQIQDRFLLAAGSVYAAYRDIFLAD